jgi:uroporphyrinogen-III synthase
MVAEKKVLPRKRLTGRRILVTRPDGQAEELCRLIEAEGGQVLHFPTVVIGEPEEKAVVEEIIQRLDDFHWAVFVSANAVQRGLQWVLSRRSLPPGIKTAVVGQATAQALTAFGLRPHLCPTSGYNSEALLAMEEWRSMAGKRVVVFRGDGGRELLAKALVTRGAQVEYAEVYRRCLPPMPIATQLRQALSERSVDRVVTTSQAILENLCQLVGEPLLKELRAIPLIVIGPRQAQQARALGFNQVVLAREPSGIALVQAMLDYEDNL